MSALSTRPADAFDVATMVLALHEVPAEARPGVLRETARGAKHLLCVDYRVLMRMSLARIAHREPRMQRRSERDA